MDRVLSLGLAVLFGMGAIVGCGSGSSSDGTSSEPAGGVAATNAADPATNPVARAASDFMDAVIKGDIQRAEARLTPLSLQRIKESDKEFKPPGLDNASFRIGEVRTPSETQAIVQCVVTHQATDGKTDSEELCCLMRLVDSEWRVSGIASSNGAGRPPIILDFENPPLPTQALPMAAAPGQPGVGTPAVGRPSPLRSAQEAPAPSLR